MPLKDLEARREYRRRYYRTPTGKAIILKGNAKWREANKPRMIELQRAWNKKQKNYYREKVRLTIYKPTRPEPLTCEGCGVPFASVAKGSQCDHDHTTGEFRGWLCRGCNIALGSVKDSPETLRNLIRYLKRHTLLS